MDNRKIYRILVASPFLLLLLLIVYCFYTGRGQHRKPTHEELDQALLRYMQSKYAIYEDTFTIDQPGDVEWASSDIFYSSTGTYKLEFESKKYPKQRMGEKVVLRYNFEENTLRDTYMSFVLHDQVEEKFREIIDQVYEPDTYELVMSAPVVPWNNCDFSASTDIEEYLAKTIKNDIDVRVIRDSNYRDEDMKKLLRELKKRGYGIDGGIYYVTRAQYDIYTGRDKWLKSGEHTYEEMVQITWKKGQEDYGIYYWDTNPY